MARVFLSYCRQDSSVAQKLATAIADAGHTVWWDRELVGGSRFANEIDRALEEATAVVVLWSEASSRSTWVLDEAAEGRDTGRLIPVTIDAAKPPLGFRQFHAIDLSAWGGEAGSPQVSGLLKAIGVAAGEVFEGSARRDKNPAPSAGKPVICVLPFINVSGDAEQEYFSDGVTEDIITDMSKVSALAVVSRHSAFAFKDTDIDAKAVARMFGATHIVTGSVRKAGERVRITVQLTDGASGNNIWAERFDRDLTDIFAIQEEISRAIVEALKVRLLPQEKIAIEERGTSSPEAYDLYLMARQYWVTGNDGDPRRDEVILRLCRSALELDPSYARAWSLIALTQSIMKFRDQELDVDGTVAAKEALRLDPTLAEPHCVIAAAHARQACFDEANAEIRVALQLDDESWEVNKEAGYVLYSQGRIAEAAPHFEKAAAAMETDYRSSGFLMGCLRSLGDERGAREAAQLTASRAEQTYSQDRNNAAAMAYAASALGHLGEAERAKEWIQRALLVDPTNLIVRYNLACVLALDLGDSEGALELLERWFESATAAELRHIEADPDMRPIRGTPRFRAMFATAERRLAAVSKKA